MTGELVAAADEPALALAVQLPGEARRAGHGHEASVRRQACSGHRLLDPPRSASSAVPVAAAPCSPEPARNLASSWLRVTGGDGRTARSRARCALRGCRQPRQRGLDPPGPRRTCEDAGRRGMRAPGRPGANGCKIDQRATAPSSSGCRASRPTRPPSPERLRTPPPALAGAPPRASVACRCAGGSTSARRMARQRRALAVVPITARQVGRLDAGVTGGLLVSTPPDAVAGRAPRTERRPIAGPSTPRSSELAAGRPPQRPGLRSAR